MTVFVRPYNPVWLKLARREIAQLNRAFDLSNVAGTIQLHHIGSTSIPGIAAKPIIDLLGEVADVTCLDAEPELFASEGYEAKGDFGIPGRRYFRKSSQDGVRTHHLHIFDAGSEGVVRHMAFRNYLRANPELSRQYSDLKQRLARDVSNMDAYMDGKDPFIKRVEREAVAWYRNKIG